MNDKGEIVFEFPEGYHMEDYIGRFTLLGLDNTKPTIIYDDKGALICGMYREDNNGFSHIEEDLFVQETPTGPYKYYRLEEIPLPTILAQKTATTALNIRYAPGADALKIGELAQGDTVDIIGYNEDGSWTQILTEGGMCAFVNSSYLA
ncbi:MAG: SH3 domain-containing protein [Clostridia bacterium]|nr:SH3 domain-containing protein [Clostridia bacterium]